MWVIRSFGGGIRVGDQIMHSGLGGDDGGFSPTFLDDFEQVEAMLVAEAVGKTNP